MDQQLTLMCGTDYLVPECKLILHQPTIKELSYIGEEEFFTNIQFLCIDKKNIKQDEVDLSTVNNFQIFMTMIESPQMKKNKKIVIDILSLLLPQYQITFSPQSIIFKKDEDIIAVDKDNFNFLQEAIKNIFCLNHVKNKENDFNPANDKAKKIAEKLKRGRQRVAAQKNNDNNVNIFSQYLSILTIGIPSMSLQNLMECTVYQLFDLMTRYSLYINWDIDLRSRFVPFAGKNDKPLEDWRKNIH